MIRIDEYSWLIDADQSVQFIDWLIRDSEVMMMLCFHYINKFTLNHWKWRNVSADKELMDL